METLRIRPEYVKDEGEEVSPVNLTDIFPQDYIDKRLRTQDIRDYWINFYTENRPYEIDVCFTDSKNNSGIIYFYRNNNLIAHCSTQDIHNHFCKTEKLNLGKIKLSTGEMANIIEHYPVIARKKKYNNNPYRPTEKKISKMVSEFVQNN